MKLLGHYIFEEDPELKAYRLNQERKHHQAIAEACEGRGKSPLANSLVHADVLSYDLAENLQWHRELAQRRECHFFNGKKYCYHTGRQIVTEDRP